MESEGIAWATLNQVVSSLRFFFGVTLGRKDLPERIAYARRPKTLPVILSPEEVATFLEAVPSRRDRVALTTTYATGLRASEVVGLCTPSQHCLGVTSTPPMSDEKHS